jgi:predicted porin
MKKSMLALAVLAAFAGAASAQSSVTLYGRAETNVTYSKPGTGDERWLMNDGGDNSGIGGSRWGLRGTEDLGGGLKAYFILESGFRTDTGAAGSATQTFNRQAYVALGSSSLGDIRLGRQEAISRLINGGFSDASGIGELKIDEGVGGGRQLFQTFGQRVDNTATYITPSFGGFQVQAMVGAGEGANARYQGIMGSYSAGPLKVALGYEEYDSFGARTGAFNKVFNVGANYNFGFATLFAGYQDSTDVGSNAGAPLTATSVRDQQAYTVGVMVPVGALQIRANYTNVDYDLNNGTSADQQKYGISVRYALSKRTGLYSAFTERDGETPTGGDASLAFTAKREFVLLGVYHAF